MTEEAPAAPASPAVQQRYSTVAVWLHWIIALAIAFQLALGFAMPKNESGFALYQFHKSVGIAILLLTLVRLGWRLTHRPPPAVEGGFSGFLAKAVHVGLYVFMIGAPLTGWALVSTDPLNIPTVLFGAIPWPHLPLPAGIAEAMEGAHGLLAWLGVLLFLLHVAGALRHQFLLRDGLLSRIGPGGKAWAAGLLALAVVVAYFATGMKVSSDVVAAGGYGPPQSAAQDPAPLAAADPQAVPAETEAVEESPVAEDAEEAQDDAPQPAEPAAPPVWTIQPGGRLAFTVSSGSDSYNGSFSDWDGAIRFDPDNPETADIRMTIRLTSASVGDATMDGMLQGADFFASAANPVATWRSTSVRRTGASSYSANGTLSLKGASKPQAVTFTLSGSGLNRKVEGSASIDRTAFGVGTGESAGGLASSVALSFAFDATGRAP